MVETEVVVAQDLQDVRRDVRVDSAEQKTGLGKVERWGAALVEDAGIAGAAEGAEVEVESEAEVAAGLGGAGIAATGAVEIVVGYEDVRAAAIEDAVIPVESEGRKTVGGEPGAVEIVAVLKDAVAAVVSVDVETATGGVESVEALKIVEVVAEVVDEEIVASAAVVIAAAFE